MTCFLELQELIINLWTDELILAFVGGPGFLVVSCLLVEDRAIFCVICLGQYSLISQDYLSEFDQIICRKLTRLLVDYLPDVVFS